MQLNAFSKLKHDSPLSEQEQAVKANDAAQASAAVVPDPVPATPPFCAPSPEPRPPQVDTMLEILRKGYGRLIDLYDEIPEGQIWRLRAVKAFVAGEEFAQIEAKINEQCRLVWVAAGDEDRGKALDRVQQGMDYLVGLVRAKVNGKR